MHDEAEYDIHLPPSGEEQMLDEFMRDYVSKIRNGEMDIDEAVAEAATTDFARDYDLSEGWLEFNLSCWLKAAMDVPAEPAM